MLVHVAEGFSVEHSSIKSLHVIENVNLGGIEEKDFPWVMEVKTDLDSYKDGPVEMTYIAKYFHFATKEKALANYHNVVSQVSAIELNLSFARGERC